MKLNDDIFWLLEFLLRSWDCNLLDFAFKFKIIGGIIGTPTMNRNIRIKTNKLVCVGVNQMGKSKFVNGFGTHAMDL